MHKDYCTSLGKMISSKFLHLKDYCCYIELIYIVSNHIKNCLVTLSMPTDVHKALYGMDRSLLGNASSKINIYKILQRRCLKDIMWQIPKMFSIDIKYFFA